jgi:hypothetical protein
VKTNRSIQSLGSTVHRHDCTYQAARERHPDLAPYGTASALFDALSKQSGLDSEARRRLLRIVVREYQRGRHALWYALAFHGLAPMLRSLRTGARRRRGDDGEQDLHVAFAEVLGRLRVDRPGGPTFPLLTLRRALVRAIFAWQEAEQAGDELQAAESPECAPSPHEDPPPFVSLLAREVGELLVESPGGEDAIRVLAGAETLADQVERLSPEDVTYACLQKRHRRAVTCVQRELSRRSS